MQSSKCGGSYSREVGSGEQGKSAAMLPGERKPSLPALPTVLFGTEEQPFSGGTQPISNSESIALPTRNTKDVHCLQTRFPARMPCLCTRWWQVQTFAVAASCCFSPVSCSQGFLEESKSASHPEDRETFHFPVWSLHYCSGTAAGDCTGRQ